MAEIKGIPYEGLGPELVLESVESLGYKCDGRLLALNSYENRVYQVGLEEGEPLVAKFYRPGRWSDEAIEEEHAFTLELAEHEIPVVPPLAYDSGRTLHLYGGFRFSLFPKRPGRTPELEDEDTLRRTGRFMGRIHAVGKTRSFSHRPRLDVETFGYEPLDYLLDGNFIPLYLETSYSTLARGVLEGAVRCYERAGRNPRADSGIRLHGDCHPGNFLWTDDGPHFVDFDDCRTGPAIQDLWMLISGERESMTSQLGAVLEGYVQFCDFDAAELNLIEPLRCLRMIHHSAWLAKRRDDPAFAASFPWFNSEAYWEGQVLALREQAALLDEPPLQL